MEDEIDVNAQGYMPSTAWARHMALVEVHMKKEVALFDLKGDIVNTIWTACGYVWHKNYQLFNKINDKWKHRLLQNIKIISFIF